MGLIKILNNFKFVKKVRIFIHIHYLHCENYEKGMEYRQFMDVPKSDPESAYIHLLIVNFKIEKYGFPLEILKFGTKICFCKCRPKVKL